MKKVTKSAIDIVRVVIFGYSLYVGYQLFHAVYFILFPQKATEIFDDCQTQIGQYTESCLVSIRANYTFMALIFAIMIIALLFVTIKGVPFIKKRWTLS